MRALFATAAVAHAVGVILVGLFHSGHEAIVNGTVVLHSIGAGMAMTGGNCAVIVAGSGALHDALRRSPHVGSIALGSIGLICLACLALDHQAGGTLPLQYGAWERGAIYTIIGWELFVGIAVMTAPRPHEF
jgi:hypothetical protein